MADYAALLDRTDRGQEPLTWAQIQMERGDLLLQLGLRERDPGTIDAAIDCLKEAEKVLTLQRAPRLRLDALMKLGEAYAHLARLRPAGEMQPNEARDASIRYLVKARDLSVLPELVEQRETCRRRLETLSQDNAVELS